ncbi:MAG: VOC family protein [Acidobacteria bacterium]|nr:VOC family protein [Acidobacteriota bacterium]
MARARAFYEGTLGLRVSEEYEGHWVEYKPGGMGVFAISDMPEVGRSCRRSGAPTRRPEGRSPSRSTTSTR